MTTIDGALGGAPVLDAQGALSELSMIRLADQPLNATLLLIADIAKRAIPGLDEVSVTVVKDQKPRSVVFTGHLAVELDERQYESGFGPCVHAAISGGTVTVDTQDMANPYPDFSRAARRAGVRHVVALGLPASADVGAGLNLYTSGDQPLSAATMELAERIAAYAAVAVGNATTYSSTSEWADQVQQLMTSRAVIEQAKGILMAQHQCSGAEAFAILIRTSQQSNVKLRDVAAAMVTSINRH
jgi:GAF domain-containing protein